MLEAARDVPDLILGGVEVDLRTGDPHGLVGADIRLRRAACPGDQEGEKEDSDQDRDPPNRAVPKPAPAASV